MKFFVHPDGSVVLLPKRPATALRGIVKARRSVSIEDMNEAIASAADGGNGSGLRANVSSRQIAHAFETMRETDSLVIQCEQEVFAAMTVVKEERGSFADALIAAPGAKAGCTKTFTFDRKAPRLTGFALC